MKKFCIVRVGQISLCKNKTNESGISPRNCQAKIKKDMHIMHRDSLLLFIFLYKIGRMLVHKNFEAQACF